MQSLPELKNIPPDLTSTSPLPDTLEGGVPGEVLRIKKVPYTQLTTKLSYPMRGKDRDIGRGLGDGDRAE